jgi:hypothetical protein
MKSALLVGLLALAGCASTPLSASEAAKALKVAGQFKAGYGLNELGKPLIDTVGLRGIFDAGYTKTYQGRADSLAYGLVAVEGGVSYTVQDGELVAVYFKAVGLHAGNKLQGCIERLYGPFVRHNLTSFEGRRGIVQAQVDRGLLGSCSVALIQGPDSSLSPPSTKAPERLKLPRSLSFTDAEYEKLGALATAARLGRSEYIIEKLGLDK